MSVVSGYANRLRLVACAVALCWLGAAPALADRSVSPGLGAATQPELGVLPTMKGHMGRLGTLMNVLFRSIDEPEDTAAVLAAVAEMKLHLQRVGETLLPDKVAAIGESTARKAAIAGFKSCIDQSVARLEEITTHLLGQRLQQAQQVLYDLDQLRRDCHSKYAALPTTTGQGAMRAEPKSRKA